MPVSFDSNYSVCRPACIFPELVFHWGSLWPIPGVLLSPASVSLCSGRVAVGLLAFLSHPRRLSIARRQIVRLYSSVCFPFAFDGVRVCV